MITGFVILVAIWMKSMSLLSSTRVLKSCLSMNETYKKSVALLIRVMPLVYKIKDFAVYGGTAINLFVKDMPRYSVDIDLTYFPIKNREESIQDINNHLSTLK
jgi:hypothetical protein